MILPPAATDQAVARNVPCTRCQADSDALIRASPQHENCQSALNWEIPDRLAKGTPLQGCAGGSTGDLLGTTGTTRTGESTGESVFFRLAVNSDKFNTSITPR